MRIKKRYNYSKIVCFDPLSVLGDQNFLVFYDFVRIDKVIEIILLFEVMNLYQ